MTVRAWSKGSAGTGSLGEPPHRIKIADAVKALREALDSAGNSDIHDPDRLVADFLNRYSSDTSLQSWTRRDTRRAARLLFYEGQAGERLIDNADFTSAFFDLVQRKPIPSLTRILTLHFFQHFEPNSAATRALAQLLTALPASSRPSLLEQALDEGFIDTRAGPKRLSEAVDAAREDDACKGMEACGLPASLHASRFAAEAFASFCGKTTDKGNDAVENIEKVLSWGFARSAGSAQQAAERYPRQLAALCGALLLPWADRADPPKPLEIRIRNLLIGVLGDPRLPKSSPRWNKVDPEAVTILRRWQNRASVLQFFDIVTETMSDPDEKRMWRYRRAFWTAYMDYLDDAYVVFATGAARLARLRAQQTGDDSFKLFGQFSTNPPLRRQAVLILRIGDATVAEWSHNGACRIWSSNEPIAPKPYQKTYGVYDLRNAKTSIVHHSNETYGWQHKVAEDLRLRTGVRLRQADYAVGS